MLAINSKFLNVIVKQEVRLYKNSEDYKDLLNRSFSQDEKDTIKLKQYKKYLDSVPKETASKKTIKILSVYDTIQKKLLDLEMDRLKKTNSFDEMVSLVYEKSRDIRFLETELFKLSRSEQLEDESLNAYYGMISNENIDLFEMIENEFEGSKQK